MRRRWMTRFPPWLAQVEANLATRKCLKSSVFVLAFHLGLSRWERIWSHDIQTGSHQSRLPVRQARRVAKTRLHSRFLVNSRGPHPPCEEGSRVCNPSFVNAAPNSLPPGQARVESKKTCVGVVRLSGFQICSHLDEPGWKAFVVQPVCQSRRFPKSPVRNQFSKHQTAQLQKLELGNESNEAKSRFSEKSRLSAISLSKRILPPETTIPTEAAHRALSRSCFFGICVAGITRMNWYPS